MDHGIQSLFDSSDDNRYRGRRPHQEDRSNESPPVPAPEQRERSLALPIEIRSAENSPVTTVITAEFSADCVRWRVILRYSEVT